MRIDVCDHAYGEQTGAYAEYRIFSTLKKFGDLVRRATVTLMPHAGVTESAGERRVSCRVEILMTHDRCAETAATANHPYGAIDRVAQRVESLMHTLPVASEREA